MAQENPNLRRPVITERSRPDDLAAYGRAGLRVTIDELLESHHGRPREDWLALGTPGLGVLHAIASGSEPHHFRRRALGLLGVIRDPSSARVLETVARDTREDEIVRAVGVRSLGQVGGEAALEPLLALLKDESPLLRSRAAEGLGAMGDERALPGLRQAAREDSAELVRTAAASAADRVELVRDLGRGEG